ncbi:hypothetical protein EBB59_13115 [Lysobacter pythonis]|uniref:Peptidoglycan binding-like domain-containing protein n=1 Tax=Solilutibacter pythonis TaxID=2483112 RepID=A0A3M2HIH5_9GAMM|nr:peptidoglycan-binding domain-containing protein [Lysobacter pythonis]RMH87380.1 hypothetical protein EBB59_13115 [Lysobacter pythonis]
MAFLQYRLHRVGMTGPEGQPVPQDGRFGPETEHAVRQFQHSHGLPATGITEGAMNNALAREHLARQTLSPSVEAMLQARREQERQAQEAHEREARERQLQEQREREAHAARELAAREARERLVRERHAEEAAQRETTPPPTPPERDYLCLGNQGNDVAFLQYRLHRVGMTGPEGHPVPQDDRFGPETEHAVRQFQHSHGLPVTGIADPSVNAALTRAHHARLPPLQPTGQDAATMASGQPRPMRPTADAPWPSVDAGIPTSPPTPGIGGGHPSREEPPEAPAPHRPTFPTDHPDHALFAAIQAQLPPGTPDEKTAEIMHAAKLKGIDHDIIRFKDVTLRGDRAFVYSHTYGKFTDALSLSAPAPPLAETLEQTRALDRKNAVEMEAFLAEQERINREHTGPVMKMTLENPGNDPGGDGGGDGGGG